MPVSKGAKKKLRVDEKRKQQNLTVKTNLKSILKKAEENLTQSLVREAVNALDKAVKKGLVHKNTAARKKSSLMKKLEKPETQEKKKPAAKKAA